jgi:glycosyltransferase involved in cell wall biosynthesis
MRVLMLSKALVVGIYQRKLEALARQGIELMAVVPPSWRDERGDTPLEHAYTQGYTLMVLPLVFNGSFHLHTYRGLGRVMRAFRPHIVHIDEEPYNLACWQAHHHAHQLGAKSLVFSWQNIRRSYPPPFSLGEAWMLNTVDHLLCGTESAAEVWRSKGYRGALSVIPQFGSDETLFCPPTTIPARPFTVGYFGRLVKEKGVHVLLAAFAALPADARLLILGSGPQQNALQAQAVQLDISERVHFQQQIPSLQMPALYHQIDVLALPSLTRPNWKEQFGRVLVEAMMSEVAVVGSDSAAIPYVIGDSGVIVPEGDPAALASALRRLYDDPAARSALAKRGRARALAHFTNGQIVSATIDVYTQMMRQPP